MRTAKAKRERLDSADRNTLMHALDVAIRTFDDNVRTMKAEKPSAFINERGLKDLAELFAGYREKAQALQAKLINVDVIEIGDEEEEV